MPKRYGRVQRELRTSLADLQHWIALACPRYGRLHLPMPEEQARAEVAACAGDNYDKYLRCGGCGSPSTGFRKASQEDIPSMRGVTHVLHACVVPGRRS